MGAKNIVLILGFVCLTGCFSSSGKTYENDKFPDKDAPWLPVNPSALSKSEIQAMIEVDR